MSNQKIVVDCSKGTIAYLPLSAAEIAERDQAAAAFAEAEAKRQADAEALAKLKESAKAKLTAGKPLTDEEAATLVI